MIKYILKYILPLVLVTVLCVVGVKTFYRMVEPRRTGVEKVSKQSPEVLSAAGKQALVENEQVNVDASVITRRNLFASKKEPAVQRAEIDPLASIKPTKLGFVLMGTAIDVDRDNRAFIYDKRKRRQDMYRKGDSLQGAIIQQISYGKVIISVNGKNELLDIAQARKIKVPQVRKPAPVNSAQEVEGQPVGAARSVKLPSGAAVVSPNARREQQSASALKIRVHRTDLPGKAPPTAEKADKGVTEGAGQ